MQKDHSKYEYYHEYFVCRHPGWEITVVQVYPPGVVARWHATGILWRRAKKAAMKAVKTKKVIKATKAHLKVKAATQPTKAIAMKTKKATKATKAHLKVKAATQPKKAMAIKAKKATKAT